MSFGQFKASTQFFLYGRNNCTRTGWEKARKKYEQPDLLEDPSLNLKDKVYMITGANAGIGREISLFAAKKGATVYMICRNPTRAEKARNEIVELAGNDKVHLLLGDCGVESDIRRIWNEFTEHRKTVTLDTTSSSSTEDSALKLDVLVCNAGALMNTRTMTKEGVEVTFATHLLFGTYLLGSLAIPYLQKSTGSRIVVVSSGGMYNSKFPSWQDATGHGLKPYDGQFAYVYAKRGQVLLCERWAALYGDKIKVVSCHPGWVRTEAVDEAYGDNKKYLEPLRNGWEGAEGIIWLTVAPTEKIEGGAFYLDRSPQAKHMSGSFFYEGTYTKNTPTEVDTMMNLLQIWSNQHPDYQRPSETECNQIRALSLPLTASLQPIEIEKFMLKWNVLSFIPSYFEVESTNGTDTYTYNSVKKHINVVFQYFPKGSTSSSTIKFKGTVFNEPTNTHWGVSPYVGFYLPFKLDYLIVDTAEDYSYTVVGVPDRSYVWIMIPNEPTEFTPMPTKDSVIEVYQLQKEVSEFPNLQKIARDGYKPSTPSTYIPIESALKVIESASETTTSSAVVEVFPDSKKNMERVVLLKALRSLNRAGYDCTKVIRAGWKQIPNNPAADISS